MSETRQEPERGGSRFGQFLGRIGGALLFPLFAILISFVIGAVIIFATGNNPVAAYGSLVYGSFGNQAAIGRTLVNTTPLVFTGLAVAVAFRAGLFNIGGEGQFYMGAVTAAWLGVSFGFLGPLAIPVVLAASAVAGFLWGALPGILKAYFGAHEVITTIMLNYVAAALLTYLLTKESFQQPGSNNPRSEKVHSAATFPSIFGVHSGIVLAVLAAVGVWWLLERSTVGFELRAVGANADAGRTAGMSVAKVYTLAMIVAGLLAGLAGTQQVLGHEDSLTASFGGSIGFDAITVALLGRATPLGTVLAGLLFGALSTGGLAMQAGAAATPLALTQVLQALIVLFVAAPALVKAVFRFRESDDGGAVMAKGWNS